jgi:CubicO group peptidase (beta-lactamase class C family)
MIGAKMMNRSWCGRPLAICAVGIAVVVVTLAASVSAADFSASDALMLRLMSTHNVPGSALALIKDGSIVLEKGYGFRDLAAHAPVTTATLFNIGSISKSRCLGPQVYAGRETLAVVGRTRHRRR